MNKVLFSAFTEFEEIDIGSVEFMMFGECFMPLSFCWDYVVFVYGGLCLGVMLSEYWTS
jgi:hypothetical protein